MTVLLHRALDGVAVDKEGLGFRSLGLLYLPVGVEVLDGAGRAVGIVLTHLLKLLLVFRHLLNQLVNIRNRSGRCLLASRRHIQQQRKRKSSRHQNSKYAHSNRSSLMHLSLKKSCLRIWFDPHNCERFWQSSLE